MRIWIHSVLALVLGTSIGWGATWVEFRGVRELFEPQSHSKTTEGPITPNTTGPVAVVEGGSQFDFGILNLDQVREQKFVVRNDGDEPLRVTWVKESCGMCIQNARHFQPELVAPGESCEVFVTYKTMKPVLRFDESAYLETNDPRNSSIRLNITGDIVQAVRLQPESLALNSILTSEHTKTSVRVYGFRTAKLRLLKTEFSHPESAAFIEVTANPLSAVDTAAFKHALVGLELTVGIKPGLPLGPLTQNMKLTFECDTTHVVDLSLSGTVVGDLTVMGAGYDASRSMFSLGLIPRGAGKTGEFFVLAKGPYRDQVAISVAEVEPADILRAEVGAPLPMTGGKAVKIPVKLTVAQDAPPVNRLGTSQGRAGRILLNTTHPFSKQISLEVRFAIE